MPLALRPYALAIAAALVAGAHGFHARPAIVRDRLLAQPRRPGLAPILCADEDERPGPGGVAPSDAGSFAEYLLPYAGLVLGAFVLASAAFAFLVLQG